MLTASTLGTVVNTCQLLTIKSVYKANDSLQQLQQNDRIETLSPMMQTQSSKKAVKENTESSKQMSER